MAITTLFSAVSTPGVQSGVANPNVAAPTQPTIFVLSGTWKGQCFVNVAVSIDGGTTYAQDSRLNFNSGLETRAAWLGAATHLIATVGRSGNDQTDGYSLTLKCI